ncbi:uncharacterized protein LOC120632636 [Pararge aegeria]|uniref:Jg12339 protein n=1 Tax=Pararge aegeria aegeria TaxID=348720 RepID=A0A8S4RA19_9NEOP|nr:uncharacterized protein LOC120632636 [Pararge aegeria]CAH2232178.1 jg12339 [Pararge aegeria aegeria]
MFQSGCEHCFATSRRLARRSSCQIANMDMDKNLLLVKMVEKFPCLYKSDTIEYSTRNCTERAWREVSKEIKLSDIECREKWRNLRYGLLRSLRPTRDGAAKKKYYLHDEMEFLIPYVRIPAKKSKKRVINYIEEMEDFNKDELEDTFENDGFNMSHDVDSYNFDDEDPLRKKAKTYETKNSYCEPDRSNVNLEDPRKMFLLSLLPEIADFSENQMKTFRRRIFGLVDEINEMETNSITMKSEPL